MRDKLSSCAMTDSIAHSSALSGNGAAEQTGGACASAGIHDSAVRGRPQQRMRWENEALASIRCRLAMTTTGGGTVNPSPPRAAGTHPTDRGVCPRPPSPERCIAAGAESEAPLPHPASPLEWTHGAIQTCGTAQDAGSATDGNRQYRDETCSGGMVPGAWH